jgi:TonB-linked SusC/RagA family outer membrane protein
MKLHLTLLTLLAALWTAAPLHADVLKGRVVDVRTLEPLPGATISIRNADVKSPAHGGVVTDIDGNFRLEIGAQLPVTVEVRLVGYLPTGIDIYDASEAVTIELTEKQNKLSDVVVVGYGTQKRENLASSVSSVGGRTISEISAPTFENALAGQASGINLTVPNGTLGQAPILRIRGVASITSGTQPLYVVDGIPVATDSYSSMNVSNPLANINAADIASIDVLKDASAAALYGSRAANGVVLITTRQGAKGRPQVDYQGYVSLTTPTAYYDLCNAVQYADLKNEGVFRRYGSYRLSNYDVASGNLGGYHLQGDVKAFNVLYDADGNPVSTDWQRYVLNNAWSQSHTLSLAGATDAVKYYFSGNWQDLRGIVRGNNQARLQVNSNITAKVNRWLTVGGRINITETRLTDYDTYNNSLYEGASVGYYWSALNIPANIPAHFADGTPWSIDGRVGYGPNQASVAMETPSVLYETDSRTTQRNSHRFYNFHANVQLLRGLVFRSQYGRDIASVEDRAYYAAETGMYKYNGYAANISTSVDQYTWTNTLTYDHIYARHHNLNLLAGVEAFEKKRTSWGAKRYNQADDSYTIYEAAYNDISSIGTARTETGMLSYLFRANYDYDSRYILSFNFRRDGLSSLSHDNRWGNFGGVSAAWKVSEEKFYAPLRSVLDDLKLRAGWGVVGNTSIAAYAASTTYTSAYNGSTPAYLRSQVADRNLKWESSEKWDVGFSGRLFNRVDVDFGYYNIRGSDLILSVPTAPSLGVTGNSITANVGSMYNRGIELTLSADLIHRRKFTWNSSFNISTGKNRVTSLGNSESIITTYNITLPGKSIGQLYLYRSGGVDPESGRRIVYDKQGNDVLITFQNGSTSYERRDGTTVSTSDLDRYAAGNTLPTFYGGWSNQLRYKYFDLAVNFQFSGGNKIWNGQKGRLAQYGFRNNTTDVYRNHWTEEHTRATYAKVVYGDNISNGNGGLPLDFLVEDGDFLRLKTLTFGYNLERKRWLRSVGISAVRLYLQATNLFVWTGYSGLDPEVSYATGGASNAYNLQAGIDDLSTPQTRTYTLGVNIKF